jgi:1-acyl-sn-glycerol-3-phosphate acyltransferase
MLDIEAAAANAGGRSRTGDDPSGEFWSTASPALLGSLARHNGRIGRALQRRVHKLVLVFAAGPIAYLAVRLLFRVRVSGVERLDAARTHAIYALRHYFEWDPLLAFYAVCWPRALTRPWLAGNSLAGQFWVRTPARRAISWILGILGLARGMGTEQSGFDRASALLAGPVPATVVICPTGPVGRRKMCGFAPGVGHLAARCPDVPVLPLTVVGLQHLRLRDVLLLRRPTLDFAFGEPFTANELAAETASARINAVCQRVTAAWSAEETRIASAETTEARSFAVVLS